MDIMYDVARSKPFLVTTFGLMICNNVGLPQGPLIRYRHQLNNIDVILDILLSTIFTNKVHFKVFI